MTTSTSPGLSPAGAQPARSSRLYYIDNLRVWLIVLVILHHLAITFGRSGPWYYVVPHTPPAATIGSTVFILINQAYFMGLFFGISAYFTPGSVDRKGMGRFVRDRAIRLGIPLLLFVFVLGPLASLYAALAEPGPYTFGTFVSTFNFGPLWFVELLIIFTAVYVGIRRGHPAPESRNETLRVRWVVIFTLALGVVTYLFRILFPLGSELGYLSLPSPYEIPQYASFFVIGILAYRRGWLTNLPSRFGVVGGVVGIVALVVLILVALPGLAQVVKPGTWQSGVYAMLEQIFAVGICLAMLVFFRRFFNHQARFGRELSRSAFPAYVVHPPVITWLAVAMAPIGLPPALGFVVAAIIGVPLVFVAASGVRRLPGLRRVF